jgi:parallel beta-helix repeat protein
MRSKIKIRFFIIFLGIFAIALISSTFMAPYNHNQELSIDEGDSEQVLTTPPKLSKSWNNFTYIHILDNWTIAAGYEWCSGDGSWSYPYVLENITINAASSPTGNGIWIQNSENDYFIIRNCSIMNSPHGGSSGGAIFIDNSNNGTLIGNNLTQNYLDIHFYRAENMTVIGNHITGEGSGTGINMYHSSNNFFLNNIVENKHYYSMLIQGLSNNNVIKGNTFIENTGTGYGSGISISQSNENNISYNILSNNNNGIKIDYTADKNIIHSNIITQNDYYGAVILNSTTNVPITFYIIIPLTIRIAVL